MNESVDLLQHHAGLVFRNPALAMRALTHHSYVNEHPEAGEDNERLEFLGDALLDYLCGAWLYRRFPEAAEGHLTRFRSALVRTETLASFARGIRLGEILRLGKGEEDSGGRARDAILCASFEALLAALYLDQGEQAVREFIEPLLETGAGKLLSLHDAMDPKSILQEWTQAELGLTPEYRTVVETGPQHAREFTVEVWVGEDLFGAGRGRSKNAAAQEAAGEALRRLGKA